MRFLNSLHNNKYFKKLFLFFILIIVVFALIFYLLLAPGPSREPRKPPVKLEPVAELRLLEVWPNEGAREDVDRFSPTFFKFSSAIDISTAIIVVKPPHAVKKYVYGHSPDVMVVEPVSEPWNSGINYSITIIKGLKGLDGSELKDNLTYEFVNNPPEYIDFE